MDLNVTDYMTCYGREGSLSLDSRWYRCLDPRSIEFVGHVHVRGRSLCFVGRITLVIPLIIKRIKSLASCV
jgi:hypothetical protein